MTDIPVSYLKSDARNGLPAFEALDQLVDQNLLAGSEPGLSAPVRILLASNLALAALSVVGLDANNHLVLATHDAVTPANSIRPIGVLVHAATSGAANATIHGEVWLTGNFNAGDDSPLVFDASFTDLASKTGAVVGDPNLIFRSRKATGAPGA
jgi:hypothetical protein